MAKDKGGGRGIGLAHVRNIGIAGQSVQIAEKRRIQLLELRIEIHEAPDPGVSVQ